MSAPLPQSVLDPATILERAAISLAWHRGQAIARCRARAEANVQDDWGYPFTQCLRALNDIRRNHELPEAKRRLNGSGTIEGRWSHIGPEWSAEAQSRR